MKYGETYNCVYTDEVEFVQEGKSGFNSHQMLSRRKRQSDETYEKPTGNILLRGVRLNTFPHRLETKQVPSSTTSIQNCSGTPS